MRSPLASLESTAPRSSNAAGNGSPLGLPLPLPLPFGRLLAGSGGAECSRLTGMEALGGAEAGKASK
eukprot:2898722-Amphidinium_carterae.2